MCVCVSHRIYSNERIIIIIIIMFIYTKNTARVSVCDCAAKRKPQSGQHYSIYTRVCENIKTAISIAHMEAEASSTLFTKL